eukprot:tig00020614_g12151.t1
MAAFVPPSPSPASLRSAVHVSPSSQLCRAVRPVAGPSQPARFFVEASSETVGRRAAASRIFQAASALAAAAAVHAAPAQAANGIFAVDADDTGAGESVSGIIDLAPGVPQPDKGVLFIVVRRFGLENGPPAAVKRVDNPIFPLFYTIGNEDMQQGGKFPAEVGITVRLDADGDGDTFTRNVNDLVGRVSQRTTAGSVGVDIQLRRLPYL